MTDEILKRLDRIEKDLYGDPEPEYVLGKAECPKESLPTDRGVLKKLESLPYEIENRASRAAQYRIEGHLRDEHRSTRQKILDRLDRIFYALTERSFRGHWSDTSADDNDEFSGFGSLR